MTQTCMYASWVFIPSQLFVVTDTSSMKVKYELNFRVGHEV